MHVDHFLPWIAGGSDDLDNLQLLCASCNLAKGAKVPSLTARAVFALGRLRSPLLGIAVAFVLSLLAIAAISQGWL